MVTVAITGHRPGAKYSARDAAKAAMAAVIEALPPPVTLISALAEGADRDAAEAALAAHGALQALTPFDHAEYRKDFADAGSIEAFDQLLAAAERIETLPSPIEPDGAYGPLRNAAYAEAGFAMLDRADLLIAVWDGRRGGHGGASTIVAAARRRGMPVVWIDSHGAHAPRLLCADRTRPAAYAPARLRRAIRRYTRRRDQSAGHASRLSSGSK